MKIKILIKEQSGAVGIRHVTDRYGKKVLAAVNKTNLSQPEKSELKNALYAVLWAHLEGQGPNKLAAIKQQLMQSNKQKIASLLSGLFYSIVAVGSAAPVAAMPGRPVAAQDLEESKEE